MAEAWSAEVQRDAALAIVARNHVAADTPRDHRVRSQTDTSRTYTVRVSRDRWTCACAHFSEVGRHCIHILAARFRLDMRARLAPADEKPLCLRCKSGDVVSNGKRYNHSGAVTRWRCNACRYKFTGAEGFRRRRAEPRTIALALDLYFRGLSLRKVADHLHQAHGIRVSAMTVYRWVTHYSSLAARWMDQQAARTGERWHVDETCVNVNGSSRYLWNVLDADTRFLLATH